MSAASRGRDGVSYSQRGPVRMDDVARRSSVEDRRPRQATRRRRIREAGGRDQGTRGPRGAGPEKANRMMVARCTRRSAFVVAVLNLRNTCCCRSLITTFAAEPAMATLLVFPRPGKSAESSKSPYPVPGRFRFPGLVLPPVLQQFRPELLP